MGQYIAKTGTPSYKLHPTYKEPSWQPNCGSKNAAKFESDELAADPVRSQYVAQHNPR
jgi:hypothetical protein